MKTKKLLLTTAIVAAMGGLYGCSEGDDSTVTIEGGVGSTAISQNCPSWSSAKPIDATGGDVCALPATILENRTLSSNITWYLESRVTVGNGNGVMSPTEGTLENGNPVVEAILTIDAGTEIKAASGTFANLLITRGSRIEAVGTANAPIIFSSDDEGYEGSGEWGGLILHGYGLHNDADYACGGGNCENVDAEGESGFAAGTSANDNSGTLKYVVVTEGGYEFAPGNEINGVSFVAVGSGTTVDYLQVNNNSDDAVEFYGGSVNAKHLVLTNNLDDSVDWDEGYQGNIQYVLVKQSADVNGNAIEADTEGTLDFLSKPTIANATFIGDGAKDTLMVFKKTSAGFLHHSVLTSATGSAITTCVDTADASMPGTDLVFTNVVADCAISGDVNLVPAPIADVMLDADYAAQATEAQTASVGTLDIANINATYAASVADPSFFDATDYAGAVDPTAAGADNWYQGWIVEGSL
ncbi:hypothetical protein [Dasania marina]|uniref:hypothetical protein n=1 Tax=Dasania marina TaxID=471499 RepID=UPI00037C3DE1|nr:hypothetical protein [Dasania marina]